MAQDMKFTKKELVTRARIRISILAYAYEFLGYSLVSDAEYDKLALELDTTTSTNDKLLDKFFKNEYQAYTGQWIHNHPEIEQIAYWAQKCVEESQK